MKVAIIGYGIEGKAAVTYWLAQGADVTVHDAHEGLQAPDGVGLVMGDDYLKGLGKYDLIVRSPGVKPWFINTTKPVTSGVREFMAKCPARIIGVTGTKGKGTTSTLITRILGEAGKRTWLGGNIGVPALSFLPKVKATDWVVLELSSFQLMDADRSPNVAVCLMIAREHMDWHRSMNEYIAAKGNIFWHQRHDDLAVYHGDNEYASQIGDLSPGRKVPYWKAPGAQVVDGRVVIEGVDICGADEVGLIGAHNLENICAAVTATWELVGRKPEPIRRAVKAFTGLENRLEFVREVGGVRYFNDSFSTTPETAIAAIRAFREPKVMILGGSEKYSEFDELARAIKEGAVRQVILVGATAERIRAALDGAGFKDYVMGPQVMPEMVDAARSMARPGDVVLLSPACASFGLFKDYKDRAEQFKDAVRKLAS